MQRTTAPGSVGGLYVDDNPALGVVGTLVVAADKNATQEEIINAIEGAGLTPSGANNAQLWAAIGARADLAAQTLTVMKNKLINGDFRFWQRGTSLAVTTGQSKYLADRWRLYLAGTSAAATYSQQAFTLGQTAVPGEPKNYGRVLITNGGDATNGAATFGQPIENVRTLAGRKATLTFWAKADSSKQASVELAQVFGTGGSPSAEVDTLIQKINLTSSWQKFTLTFDVPSITGKTIGSNGDQTSNLTVTFWLSAGSAFNSRTSSLGIQTGTFDFAMVQLEEGQLATSFEQRPDGLEFLLCQRYFELSAPMAMGLNPAGNTALNFQIDFRVPKRIAPTVTPVKTAGTDIKWRTGGSSWTALYNLNYFTIAEQVIGSAHSIALQITSNGTGAAGPGHIWDSTGASLVAIDDEF